MRTLKDIMAEVEHDEGCAFIFGPSTIKLIQEVWKHAAEEQRKACSDVFELQANQNKAYNCPLVEIKLE